MFLLFSDLRWRITDMQIKDDGAAGNESHR